MVGAYAAGDSKFNWEVEREWTQPQKALIGVELGKRAVDDPMAPFNGFEDKEKALQHISDAAMKEMEALLCGCKTGGNNWIVNAPTSMELIKDFDDIRDYYAAGPRAMNQDRFAKIKAEAADFAAHMEKTPSFLQFRMCCNENPCAECIRSMDVRKRSSPGWNPQTSLRLLRWNDYWFPCPELKDEKLIEQHCPPSDEPDLPRDDNEDASRPAGDVHRPAEEEPRKRLAEIESEMQHAIAQENFMAAHALKIEKTNLSQTLHNICKQTWPARPLRVCALPTTSSDPWATPGPSPCPTSDISSYSCRVNSKLLRTCPLLVVFSVEF